MTASTEDRSRRVIPIVPVDGTRQAEPPSMRTVSLYEKQRKIYPRAAHGWFAPWRWVMVWLTQLLFYGLPWLPWNGRQAVLFDLSARRFYIFDLVLYPQDFIYLTSLLVLCAFGLFFVTAVAGRLWCGYACPQTVYTEIFLWVERLTEGERGSRMKRDTSPWSWDKAWRKAAKHGIWLTIGLWTGFSFVGYFTPIQTLWGQAFTANFGPWEWFWVNFYGLATYGNAGFLREQVCKYMCPYARFQSAMFDRDTLIISYDARRGEPRGKRGRQTDLKASALGHCIDCQLCVHVCPVGIDIRDGLQYECIACTACIDACDGVMDKMHYPRGLIRYATQNGLEQQWSRRQMFKRIARPRVLIYGVVLIALSSALAAALTWRHTFRVDVVRDRAVLSRMVGRGDIENVYRLQLMNATELPQHYRVSIQGIDGARIEAQPDTAVAPAQARWISLAVRVTHAAAQALGPGAHTLAFTVSSPSEQVSEPSTFVVPR